MKSRSQIGLALDGGGARGIAHIGVLKALEQESRSQKTGQRAGVLKLEAISKIGFWFLSA